MTYKNRAGLLIAIVWAALMNVASLIMAVAVDDQKVSFMMTVAYYVLPNFRNFNVISGAITGVVHCNAVPAGQVLVNTANAALYIGLVLWLSVLTFERRNLK